MNNAHEVLEAAKTKAARLHDIVESGRGGTHQARYERDVINESVSNRVAHLDIGDASLVFGRLDLAEESGGETFYIGRVAVWDDDQEPITVDWRAPVAEPFYRATGPSPMGLVRRRHFATRSRTLLGIEDEYFGETSGMDLGDGPVIKGRETLAITMEQARTGRLGDIIATIQSEQDEIIRAPLPGILVVQGGPGTGKTVVALHRAAYLLYTHRFPLDGQGVLVIGPNRVFLTYIEQVLPSLGEAGVQTVVLSDLVPRVRVRGVDTEDIGEVKGAPAMTVVLRNAVKDRQRALREDLVVGFGLQRLRMTVEESAAIVADAQRRYRKHNAARSFIEGEVYRTLAESSREAMEIRTVRDRLEGSYELRATLDWMWPVLLPEQLLHDLFGSVNLLRLAARKVVSKRNILRLHRQRSASVGEVVWTAEDVPLLDEARSILGPRLGRKGEDAIRTYGHIVIDEAQDLSPMQLRMVRRRSLNGSLTIVGDIAQATGPWAHENWEGLVSDLQKKSEPRYTELTVGYRLPQPTMDVANRIQAVAAPHLKAPTAVRQEGFEPRFLRADNPASLGALVAALAPKELEAVGAGNLAIIAPDSLLDTVSTALDTAGIDHGRIYERALESQVTVVPVRLVKGLELDAAIVIEPAAIVEEERNGLQSLYVAITRATRRLHIVHARPLPLALTEA